MLSELCVRRPVFATMLVTSLVVLGIFSFRDLGVDLFPKADPATVNVRLQLPGASPDEMTTAVVMPMENALSGIAGIDQLTANVSAGGSANITVRFVLERDLDDAANNVREKVAGAMRNVPPEVLPPVIQKADPDAEPIMSIVLASKTMTLRALTEIADKQVKRVHRVGGRRRRRHHERRPGPRDPRRGGHREAERARPVDRPGARRDPEGERRDPGRHHRTGRLGGRPAHARAASTRPASSTTSSSRPSTACRSASPTSATPRTRSRRPASALFLDDGSPAVQLDIRRASGENTIKVTEAIKARLRPIRQTLPAGVSLTLSTDDSRFIYASISSLEEHLIWGSLLAAVVVMFFIRNLRAVIISALAIPASIVATFTLMRGMDFTLNNMTLLAPHAGRRHRHRRRDRRAREHLPLHRGEEVLAVRGGDRGHARGGAAGDGDHAVAGRHLPAGRLHDRLRPPLHLPVRVDDGVRDHGVDDRELHAHADAERAFPEAGRRRARPEDQGPRLLPLDRPASTPGRSSGRSPIR